MEQMIDKNLIKKHRRERAWSQDQLSSVSGLSLRTVQRIENEGTCSLESKKALASVFEINAHDLDLNTTEINTLASNKRGRKFRFAGLTIGFSSVIIGFVSAYIGITMSFSSGYITSSEAGMYYGSVGAFCGTIFAAIGILTNKYRASAA